MTDDIDRLAFNTAISRMMEFTNFMSGQETRSKSVLESFAILLSPFAPHVSEELWQKLGHEKLLCHEPWPSWDAKHLVETTIEYPVQVNGKLRATFTIAADASDEAVKEAALSNERVKAAIEGKTVVKIILIPKKLVNLVVK